MDKVRRQIIIGGAAFIGGGATFVGGGAMAARAKATSGSVADQFAARLSAHDIEGFAALFADEYINHQLSAAAPAPVNVTPKQGTIAFFKARLSGLPDLKVAIETQLASDDKVAASFVYTGTHRAPYLGIAPTGRTLRFTSCDIFRVADGKIVEHWGMGDIAGVMAQLKG